MSQIYTSPAIEDSMSNINTTVKGGSYLDASGKEADLPDSKDVTKRKKEIRLGSTYISRAEKNQSNIRLSKAITKNVNGKITASEVKVIASSISSHIGNFIEAMSGSKKYNELVATYLHSVITQTLLNYIEAPFLESDE